MKRRAFISGLASTAAAWPLLAHGQNKPAAVIGFVHSGSPEPAVDAVAAFRSGLAALGYIEGANLAIEYRWAHDEYDRLPALMADVADRPVALIAATGGPVAALAAKSVTTHCRSSLRASQTPWEVGSSRASTVRGATSPGRPG